MNTMTKLRKGIETNIDMFEWFGKHHKGMSKSQYMKLVESAKAWKDILNGIYALIEQCSFAENYLDYELKDDNTEIGGIAYLGETLGDFIEDIECNTNVTGLKQANMRKINHYLKVNGIQPIPIKMADFGLEEDYESDNN